MYSVIDQDRMYPIGIKLQHPLLKNNNMLREYQLEGINWLLYEYYAGTNCILADEMGLGKTIQSITYLIEVRKLNIRGPFLIIAPLSTIGNWYREFRSWSDFNVVVFHGTASSRNIIHRYELYYRNEHGDVIPGALKFEVLITTYEMILAENTFLRGVNWRIAIVDEAHRLKNRNCKLLENLSSINIEHRVLLTGTPLQNTFDELLSLLNFLEPVRAKALEQIVKTSGKLESNAQVQQIQAFLKPVILRRLKEDVEKNIAPKEETIIEVEMTSIQKKVYRGILERNLSFLTKGNSSTNLPNLMNIMMELRKCCNHPFLINGVEDKIIGEYISAHPEMDRKSVYVKGLVESSGKLVLVNKLLPKLRQNGHKMLIFSQMVRVLDLIEEYLVANNFIFERIDGSVRGNLRQAAIDRFSKPDSDRSVFLLCTKAGGLGINLTAADTVIIFDSDWNPQNDIQAQARCHRIGQNKAVKVYRLICRKTYEREMFDRASLKLGLDKAVLQDINCSSADAKNQINPRAQLTKKEVEELLRRGAYAAVMDEDTEASAQFCSEDIEQILERRATVVQIAGATKGSTFAKASFNAEISSEQVDIDDPDFWQKWAKSAKVNSAVVTEFMEDKPRIRKQIQHIDTDPDVDYSSMVSDDEHVRNNTTGRVTVCRTSWQRKECLKVEKYLLIYGWGRWNEILKNASFKTSISLRDVEQISKTILIIAWNACKTETAFTDFVEKAIRMTTFKSRQEELDSEDYNYRPYGKRTRSKNAKSSKRKSEKIKMCLIQAGTDWKNIDIDTLVLDLGYKKHLLHCSSKILIRLRLLFIIEYYALREAKEEVLIGVSVEDLDIKLHPVNQAGIVFPSWWDINCDKSLIIGTFKHGYEQYNLIKSDKQLCFVRHLGVHDNKAPSDSCEAVVKRRGRKKKVVAPIASDDDDAIETTLFNEATAETIPKEENDDTASRKCNDMPQRGECNTYLKRLVMGYWKNRLKSQSKNTDGSKKHDHTVRSKWTRKEESDFYKAVVAFGIERSPENDELILWSNFRTISKLDRKDDEMLSTYACTLITRCQNLISKVTTTESIEGTIQDTDMSNTADGFITFEKANRAINRIEFFDLLRLALISNDTAVLLDKISTVPTNTELPEWWNNTFDIDLMKGVSHYGLDQNDKRIFDDENLGFKQILNKFHQSFINSPELVTGVTDVSESTDLGVEMIRAIIRWPKLKTIIDRIYGLSVFITSNVWYDKYDKETLIQSKKMSPPYLEIQENNMIEENIILDTHTTNCMTNEIDDTDLQIPPLILNTIQVNDSTLNNESNEES